MGKMKLHRLVVLVLVFLVLAGGMVSCGKDKQNDNSQKYDNGEEIDGSDKDFSKLY